MLGLTSNASSWLLATAALLHSTRAAPAETSSSNSSHCPNSHLGQAFDYVIIGGGTAGLVVARRLSEDPGTTVAVIEAGTFPEDVHGNWTQVPMYAGNFYHIDDPMMWPFQTTPQVVSFATCCVPSVTQRTSPFRRSTFLTQLVQGLNNQPRPYFRPKALGGCSDINSMAFGHTSIGSHQLMADTVNDQAYTYNNMLKYYHKTMNFTPPANTRFANATPEYDPHDTVTTGVLGVTYPAYAQSWSTWLAKGMDAIGIKAVNAFVTGNLFGHSFHMNTITHSNGFRSSSEAAYLRPVLGRQNLVVFDETMVQRILFNGNKAATGVLTTTNCTIRAKKEVILSAGVFQSPQLLLVSGVGPKALLESFNIPVVADRPGVGQNLKEHIVSFVSYQVNLITGSSLADPAYLAEAIVDFNTNATGPLTSVGKCNFVL